MSQAKKRKNASDAAKRVGIEKKPKTVTVRIDELNIDPKYQRPARDQRVKRFASHFNPKLCGPLIVNKRPSGKLFIIDGNHRRNVLQTAGKKEWEAYIFDGLTSSEEAELFDELNTQRTNASAAERFKARLHYREPVATTIADTVDACGFSLVLEGLASKKDGRIIHAVGALEAIFRKGNQPGLKTVLDLISDCWDEDETTRTDALVMKGIHYVLSNAVWKDRIDLEHLKKRLAAVPISKLVRKAKAFQAEGSESAVVLFAHAVVIENNKKLRKKSGPPYLPLKGMQ